MEPEAFAERGDGGGQAGAERPARAGGVHPDRAVLWRGVRRTEQPVIVKGGVRREDRAVEGRGSAAARQDEQLTVRRAGVPINVAKELMGHANISVTANIYTHRDQKVLHNNMAKLNPKGRRAVGKTQEKTV